MSAIPSAVDSFSVRLAELGWVSDLFVAGSLALGDYNRERHRPGFGITRAELTRHGFAVFGRDPASLLPAMSDDEVRAAARAEVSG